MNDSSLVTKFRTPDNFIALLSAQQYGPTTQLIASDVSSSSSPLFDCPLYVVHLLACLFIYFVCLCIYVFKLFHRGFPGGLGTQKYKYHTMLRVEEHHEG